MSTISAGTTTTTALVQTGDTTGNLVLATGSTPTTALTLNSTTQAATFAGAVTAPSVTTTGTINATNTFGFKNRIINGGMTIDQRNAGASVTPTDLSYTLDRWYANLSQTGKFSVQQNAGAVTPPAGYKSYLGVTSLSSYSVGASDYFAVAQVIEGLNMSDLAWGTASAKTVTLSFWVYSSLTGTFGGSLRNSAENYWYPFSYTISAANTWEQKSVTIVGPTSGTWLTTNGVGTRVWFSLGTGSTYSGPAGSWTSTTYASATGATSVVGTNGATFYITGVQLEVGSQATSFDFRDYGRELMLCQRYYYKQNAGPQYSRFGSGFSGGAANTFYPFIPLPVTMRSAPTSVTVTGNIGAWAGGTVYSVTGISIETSSTSNVVVGLSTTATGVTALAPYQIIQNNDSTASLAYSAEL